jgi:aspartate aminotransferase-like enzyme
MRTLHHLSGRHFLQIPGPTNVPERVLHAMSYPTIDHRGPAFQALGQVVLEGLKPIFGTASPILIFPSSGTGAWEAALVNTLSPGDRVLMFETGHFASLWRNMAAEGLEQVFARHDRHAEATRRAVRAWGFETVCLDPEEYSSSLTAVLMPEGSYPDALRKIILNDFDMSLGAGLSKLAGRVFRIGHLGDLNDLTLAGTLCGVEMGLACSGIPFKSGGGTGGARLSG